ncbi:MAG: hypothetical protein AVDCRST_MAG96-901 [uncultured Segetibacter sp.]|uniref:Uncharacterized protein n=1 Tax=uncultured Segetibacter sp. TaxID=481133 RepID=A0A6J4RPX6_9BACT|nr:MAG: hypothetical protein AVDCRST_MAG96-901 [uncultured Segetibacter sp.]
MRRPLPAELKTIAYLLFFNQEKICLFSAIRYYKGQLTGGNEGWPLAAKDI